LGLAPQQACAQQPRRQTPALSADGSVVFQSLATNLVAGDSNGTQDIFLRAPPWQ
jgi:hypothetical protein